MAKRSCDQINLDVLTAMRKLKPEDCTVTNIHKMVGKGGHPSRDAGNTTRILHRMRVHGLVEQTDRLTWKPTLAGLTWYEDWLKEQSRR